MNNIKIIESACKTYAIHVSENTSSKLVVSMVDNKRSISIRTIWGSGEKAPWVRPENFEQRVAGASKPQWDGRFSDQETKDWQVHIVSVLIQSGFKDRSLMTKTTPSANPAPPISPVPPVPTQKQILGLNHGWSHGQHKEVSTETSKVVFKFSEKIGFYLIVDGKTKQQSLNSGEDRFHFELSQKWAISFLKEAGILLVRK